MLILRPLEELEVTRLIDSTQSPALTLILILLPTLTLTLTLTLGKRLIHSPESLEQREKEKRKTKEDLEYFLKRRPEHHVLLKAGIVKYPEEED